MAQIIHDISTPNDGLGDELRTAFDHQNEMNTELYTTKVDKITGKGLSTNDYTNAEKTKLSGIEDGAQVNVKSDWNATSGDAEILNKPEQLFASVGYFDYNDLATQTTPLNYTDGIELQLENDTLGDNTNISQAPYGVSTIWDEVTNTFDFSSLSIGDTIDLRVDLNIKTLSPTSNIAVYLRIAEGTANEYDVFVGEKYFKTAVDFKNTKFEVGFYIGNEDVRTVPAKLILISDDTNGLVKVNGWYTRVIRKDINVISFLNDDTKLDKDILSYDAVSLPLVDSDKILVNRVGTWYKVDKSEIGGVEATDFTNHITNTSNPHNVTKSQVGLSNVDNTSDLSKPISTATQNALDLKEDVVNKATNLTSPDNTKYPTTQAVVDGLATKQNVLTNPITGTGTVNYLSKFTASGTIGDSQIFDNGTNVGIGTTSPQARLDIRAQGALSTDIAFRVRNSTDTQNFLVVNGAGDVYNRGAQGGASNTFFGENVGRNATNGNNSFFGYLAGRNNTTGAFNSFFGTSAGRQNTSGVSNSFFGTNAGLKTIASNNSFFGAGAGQENTTGTANVFIGQAAGNIIADGTTANKNSGNSVFLGAGTRALGDNQINQIVIGHNAVGDGSNSVVLGNSSITRTQLRGQVIIGTFATAPTGIEGAIYYNSTDKKHYGFNGTTWNALY